ncbi:tRNA (adenosine(37)-N6)-threonylcarbamoyltransferase complex transferase subunit TsaD [Candidatus Parcubacteria bacterium]|nr:tRNA (adenosine(37)-N6)-threonylcarbamoyltransferase complex transferase subunit TsaD [Candidatus Parcubacteria bacterium]
MKILAIETSCDDTGIAILEAKDGKFTVLSNIVSSQTIHQNYGGVFPIMAKREHQRNLVPVLEQALKQAKLLEIQNAKIKDQNDNSKLKILEEILEKEAGLYESVKGFLETYGKPDVDAIAVTHGPGLEPCLYVGVNFAKALSYVWDIPVIPVNHIEGHILVNFLDPSNSSGQATKIEFPAMSLIVSGGHTQLILVKEIGDYEIVGETLDDAAGECFDKATRILGLGYPGGPIISTIASDVQRLRDDGRWTSDTVKLPRPMIHAKNYDFSFSGLKTAVLYETQGKELTKEYVAQVCFEVQEAIIEVLLKKTLAAAKNYNAKTIIIGGGVSANQKLRETFSEITDVKVIFPDAKLSTDNGLMIAVAGYFNENKKVAWQNVSVQANLRIK